MSIDSSIEEIADFCAFTGGHCEERPVLCWNPGSYTYLFSPTADSISYLRDRVTGPSISKTVASYLLQLATYSPRLLKLHPTISSRHISVPEKSDISFGIEGYRINLFDFTNDLVYTFPTSHSDTQQTHILTNEINVRRSLPEEVAAPKLIDWSTEYPYIVEAFIRGKELRDPVTDWRAMIAALESMNYLYMQPPTSFVEMETALQDIEESYRRQQFEQSDKIRKSVKTLQKVELPERIRWCRIHSDFHAGNIIKHDDGISILDWEKTTIGYPTKDLFKPFVTYFRRSGDATSIEQIVKMSGKGGEIVKSYARRCGQIVYESQQFYPGLFLFYLLERILILEDYEQRVEWQLLNVVRDALEV